MPARIRAKWAGAAHWNTLSRPIPGVRGIAVDQSWPADRVERWPIDRLLPYSRNARSHSPVQVDQIAASMREWGWTNPVLVDEDGMRSANRRTHPQIVVLDPKDHRHAVS